MSASFPGVKLAEDPRGFLMVAAPPEATLRWMLAAVDEVAQATGGRPALRLLLDMSAAVPAPGMVEQVILGEHAARQLGHLGKVASLVARGTKTELPELVARRLGLRLKVFTTESAAVKWLSS